MSGRGFTLHTLARVLKASMTSMISFFFGQPHLGHLIFEQGSGLRGFTEGEKSKEGLVGDSGGAKTAAKQATCEWCWYLRGFRGNFLLEGSRKIWWSGYSGSRRPFLSFGICKADVFAATVPQRERRGVADMSCPVTGWVSPFWRR